MRYFCGYFRGIFGGNFKRNFGVNFLTGFQNAFTPKISLYNAVLHNLFSAKKYAEFMVNFRYFFGVIFGHFLR